MIISRHAPAHRFARGYALLIALALTAMSATVLASVARYSMERAAAAQNAEHEVQLRWGMISVRDAMLPTAGQRFNEAAEAALAADRRRKEENRSGQLELPRTLRLERWLGQVRFTVVLRDESARVNVNGIYRRSGRSLESLRMMIETAARQSDERGRVELRPHRFADARRRAFAGGVEERMFNTFDQVFDAGPLQLIGRSIDDTGLAAELTCWGSERVNPMRASLPTLRLALGRWLSDSDIQRALSGWRDNPQVSLRALLVASARPGSRAAVEDATTDQSDCYSVWVTATSRTGQRHAWAIEQRDDDGPATFEFAW